MIYLIISILISSLIFVIFKLFAVFNINRVQAIVVNYIVALIAGFYSSETTLNVLEITDKPWFFGAFLLGFLFISIFNVMGITAQRNGLAVASVAGKMSVVIPIVFGIFLYDESIGFVKIIGIILALLAVYLTSAKSDTDSIISFKNLKYPIILFLGSGCIDTLLKYMQNTAVSETAVSMFLSTVFGFAFIIGFLSLMTTFIKKKNIKIHWKSILGGVILGVPNYYSMNFLIKALQTEGLESSTLFTINNVSVVILTTIFALLFFKEKLIKKNWIGIILAIISILLVVWK